MAIGNLILGTARKKIGDVVTYRMNGKQMARAYQPRVRNPKSDAQMYQRALLATVSQAYRAGKAIFDHSFQGKSVPYGSFNRFRKVNLNYLRQCLSADVEGGATAETGLLAVIGKGASMPTPNAYIVSEGTLIQRMFAVNEVAGSGDIQAFKVPTVALALEPTTGELLKDFVGRAGIEPGDIFTILAFGADDTTVTDQPGTQFGFVRLIVKTVSSESTTTVAAAKFSDLFEVESTSIDFDTEKLLTAAVTLADICGDNYSVFGSMGVIQSRDNSGLRSTCQLSFGSTEPMVPTTGIKTPYILGTWGKDATALTQSPLILEGGNF